CRAARARLRALVTDSTVESSMSATSLARKPRTSRRTRTASWRGGKGWGGGRRKGLEGGHEGGRDRSGLLVAGLGPGGHVDRTLEEGVRYRLEPYDFAQPGRLWRGDAGAAPTPLRGRTVRR